MTEDNSGTGYTHPLYAESLAEFGQPMALPECVGWVLNRPNPHASKMDAMGCYPLFSCRNWSKLRDDIQAIAQQLLTLAVVIDPFAPLSTGELLQCFDFAKPFKEHYVVDLSCPSEDHVTRHHRYYARKSLQTVNVQMERDPLGRLDEWCGLYQNLIDRHQLRGIKAFSRECFRKQLQVPGLVMFTATIGNEIVGAQLWYIQGDVGYSHLTAVNDAGYASRATYGIYWGAIEGFKTSFAGRLRWLDLGAGAGVSSSEKDGLGEFKRGWASGTKPAFFCGKVFDPKSYAEIVRQLGLENINFFPAYRHREFS